MRFAHLTLEKRKTIKKVFHDGGNHVEVFVPLDIPVELAMRMIKKIVDCHPVAFAFGEKANEIWIREVARHVPFIHDVKKKDAIINALVKVCDDTHFNNVVDGFFEPGDVASVTSTLLERHEEKLRHRRKLFT